MTAIDMQFGRRVLAGAALAVGAWAFAATAHADTLYVDPAAPAWAHALANLALFAHIGGGVVGLISGAGALAFRKGGRLHRMAGTVFFVSMLTMAGVAAPVAVLMGDRVNVLAAIFTLYLLATAWWTVRRKSPVIGAFDIATFCVALAVVATAIAFILQAAASPTGTIDGAPPQANYIFAIIAGFAAVFDLRVMLAGGILGVQRIARHLWRMCFALFVASGSLFLGQPQVFPEPLRGSLPLIVLALAPLGFLIFWQVRVRFSKVFRPAPPAAFRQSL